MRSGLPDAPKLSVVLAPPVGAAHTGRHRSPAHLLPSAIALTVLLSGCAYPVPVAVQQPARVTTTTTTTTTPAPTSTTTPTTTTTTTPTTTTGTTTTSGP